MLNIKMLTKALQECKYHKFAQIQPKKLGQVSMVYLHNKWQAVMGVDMPKITIIPDDNAIFWPPSYVILSSRNLNHKPYSGCYLLSSSRIFNLFFAFLYEVISNCWQARFLQINHSCIHSVPRPRRSLKMISVYVFFGNALIA